jgi:hypothetical protein
MFASFRLISVASVLLAMSSLSIRADIVTLTWTGTTQSVSQDNVGIFGPIGQVIPANTPYSAVYVFDTTVGFFFNGTNSSEEVSGGTFFNPDLPSPLVGDATFTLNGITPALNGLFFASYFRQSGLGASLISSDTIAAIGGIPLYDGQVFQRSSRNDNSYGLPLNQPGTINFGAGDSTFGFFSYRTRDSNGNILASTGINLIPTSVTIAVQIPEPQPLVILAPLVAAIVLFRRVSC